MVACTTGTRRALAALDMPGRAEDKPQGWGLSPASENPPGIEGCPSGFSIESRNMTASAASAGSDTVNRSSRNPPC